MKSPEEKHEARVERAYQSMRCLTIGSIFNKHPNGLACLFQKLVRLKARDKHGICECITCGKRQPWQEMDSGHYIPRTNKATALDERNVSVQCVFCNRHGSGELAKYREALIAKYGIEAVEELETKRLDRNHTWDRRELAKIKIALLDELKTYEH